MGLLYKEKDEVITKVEVKFIDNKVHLIFTQDGGKFHTEEVIDEYILTPEELLLKLQNTNNL